jgi:hypothetical protein
MRTKPEALKGRNPDLALSGLRLRTLSQNRALPYPNDYKAFSLKLTAMASGLHEPVKPHFHCLFAALFLLLWHYE